MATGMGLHKRRKKFLSGLDKGGLHRALNVPEGQKIPAGKVASAANSANPDLRRKANFAKTAATWRH